jgi:hypothetical protein
VALNLTWEEFVARPAVRGVCLGDCAIAKDYDWEEAPHIPEFEQAHAHNTGRGRGWICVRYPQRLMRPSNQRYVSATLLHELCHLEHPELSTGTSDKGHHPPAFWKVLRQEYGLRH